MIWKIALGTVIGGIVLGVMRLVVPWVVVALIAVVVVFDQRFKRKA